MKATDNNAPPETDGKATPTDRPRSPALDERIFMGFVVAGVIAMVAVMKFGHLGSGDTVPLREYRHVGDFKLIERSGRLVTEADLKGKIVVVDFFFGGCSDQCVTFGRQFSAVQAAIAGMTNVMLVSITVDPGSDTPEALSRYAKRVDADPNRWLFLTGERRIIYPLIQQSFLLAVEEEKGQPQTAMPGFIHSDKIALVDRRGVVRAYYDGLDARAPEKILDGIKQVQTEANQH